MCNFFAAMAFMRYHPHQNAFTVPLRRQTNDFVLRAA